MIVNVAASSTDNSYEVSYLAPFQDASFISRLSRFSMVEIKSGTITIDPVLANVNVAVRPLPQSLLANAAIAGLSVFNDGYSSIAYFSSNITVPQQATFEIVFPPEPFSMLVYGPASLAPPPGFVVGVKRVSRGSSVSTWREFSLSVRFSFLCSVAGHGVALS